jgi:hypothetical protein
LHGQHHLLPLQPLHRRLVMRLKQSFHLRLVLLEETIVSQQDDMFLFQQSRKFLLKTGKLAG